MQTFKQSPTQPDFVQNPYPFYETLRASGDLVWWEDYDCVKATSHGAVNAFFRDKNWGREIPEAVRPPRPDHLKPFLDVEKHSMLERDPPVHTRLRSQVVRAFTSRRIASFGPETRALANQLIDGFSGDSTDLITQFCAPIPVTIIARLLGVPEEMGPQLLRWSNDMVAMYQASRNRATEDKAVAATQAFSAFLAEYIAKRQKSPREDLISALIAATGDKLTPEELTSTCILLLNAGHEATVHAMGNAVKTLVESGQDIAALLRDEQVAATVEETLRYDPPLHIFERYAKADCTVYGHDFKLGDKIGLMLASANRDAGVYEDAESFDPLRKPVAHTSFGAGIHFCVGAPLARIELQIALQTLFKRLPDLRIAGPLRYANKYHFHGLEALPISAG